MMKFTGRPPKFQNPDELEQKVELYFEKCNDDDEPYTVTGLAMTLGISVQGLRNYRDCINDSELLNQFTYEEKKRLSCIVQRAYLMCEHYSELKMLDPKVTKSPVGYLFALKNFKGDFVDKVEVEQSNREIKVELTD